MNTSYIYRHIRPDTNQVFYIGIGSHQRKWKHARAHTSISRNIYWKRIVAKCGGLFKVEILFDELTKEEVIQKEIEFIGLYGRSDLKKGTLCNLTNGGEGIYELSEESRKRIGDGNRGNKNHNFGKSHSEEWKKLKSDSMRGSNNHNYGKPLPEWQAELNRKRQLGNKQTVETIELRVSQFRKKVINTLTEEIYPSIQDVALIHGKSPCHMTRLIKSGKHNLKFI